MMGHGVVAWLLEKKSAWGSTCKFHLLFKLALSVAHQARRVDVTEPAWKTPAQPRLHGALLSVLH